MSPHSTFDSLRPILQTYSVLAITLAAGTNLSSTLVTLPALLPSPPRTLATQWKTLFDHGIRPVVTLTLSSAAGFAVLAYHATSTAHAVLTPSSSALLLHRVRGLYAGAAVLAVGLAPYTQVLMGGVNGELARRAGAGGGEKEEEGTRELVERWGRLNLWRGVMLLCSAGVGLWGVVIE